METPSMTTGISTGSMPDRYTVHVEANRAVWLLGWFAVKRTVVR
jgi:hypothetical protein